MRTHNFFTRTLITAAVAATLVVGAPLAAQESFFDEGSTDGAGSKSGSGDGGTSASGPTLEWSGEVNFATYTFIEWDDLPKGPVDEIEDSDKVGISELRLDAEYEGANSEAVGSLEYSNDVAFRDDMSAEDLINEAYFTLYYDRFDLSAGYMKQVWGTTDSIHVVDVLNPIDYRRFILPDYLERNIAEKMIKADIYVGQNGSLELAYVPFFHTDEYATTGRWKPQRLDTLSEALWPGVSYEDTVMNNLSEELEETELGEGQYGVRYSGSAGGFDFGATYYYGYDRTPVVNNKTGELYFNRHHLFGVEGATVVSGFNLRAEAGYFLTEDFEGDDPLLRNNRIEYIAGFDRSIPLSNLKLQLQHVGSYIINSSEIEEPVSPTNPDPDPMDNEYDEDGDYTSNTVTARLSDDYANDSIRVEIRGSYNIEKEDYMITPELELVLRDDATVTVSAPVFEGDENGQFGQYSNNDLLKIDFSYKF